VTERTWLITGVNTGFGRLMSEQLLARGSRVAGTVRNRGSVDDLQSTYGHLFWQAHLDVTDTNEIRKVVNAAFTELGRIDVVVNNAGFGLLGAAEELTDEQILQQINTNLVGSIQVTRAALPHLRQQGGGHIVQFSSMAGQAAFPGGTLYHASKWGIEGFMEALHQEVAAFNISVTVVEPGSARTEFRNTMQFAPPLEAYASTPAGRTRALMEGRNNAPSHGDPAKIAKAVIDSIESASVPRRLCLGSDAYAAMHRSISSRLAELESQKELAGSTDWD
jgi:NAD(P)-dependent dehydrogenase (short-subunit alcohol dehydrogenase family)